MNEVAWQPQLPIRVLRDDIASRFAEHANFLLTDLRTRRLEVRLFPAPDPQFSGHMIRRAVSYNPGWYSELYNNHRNGVARGNCEQALKRISSFEDQPETTYKFRYDTLLRSEITTQLTEGFVFGFQEIPPDFVVRKYFHLESRPVTEVPEVTSYVSKSLGLPELAPF